MILPTKIIRDTVHFREFQKIRIVVMILFHLRVMIVKEVPCLIIRPIIFWVPYTKMLRRQMNLQHQNLKVRNRKRLWERHLPIRVISRCWVLVPSLQLLNKKLLLLIVNSRNLNSLTLNYKITLKT